MPSNVAAFRQGWRYARSLGPAVGENISEPASEGPLRAYFDAHSEGPGIWKWLHYFPIYERHLARYADRDAHLVEIGIYSGGSLPMWIDRLGPRLHVHGVDIEAACRTYQTDQIDVHIGDQASPSFWRQFLTEVPRIDILIDDGGHEPHQQIATLKAALPAISPGGVYICEDVHGSDHPFHSFIDGLGRGLNSVLSTTPNSLQHHVGSIHRYPALIVIEKPALPVADFEAPRHGTQWQPFL